MNRKGPMRCLDAIVHSIGTARSVPSKKTEKKKLICECGYSDYLRSTFGRGIVCERCGRVYNHENRMIRDAVI